MNITRNIQPEFIDDRGAITKILDDGKTAVRSILLISSKKGSVRASHYHKKDSHFAYMLSGKMEYSEYPVGREKEKQSAIIEAGDMVYSAPMMVHLMRFLEDSVFLTLATESRSQEAYEEDTVRLKVI